MRFLANENFPGAAVQALREAGHDVAWIREDARGAADPVVLRRSVREDRVLLTFDRDFGALAFRSGADASCGIVLFRVVLRPSALVRLILDTLRSRVDWAGHFSTVDGARVRMRRLPSSSA